ncbi:NAD(P)/FAD-dependent oxidoreductase [Fimbriimonas ginsengisoli]|uniref:Halogenase n=1 Tax=Fimbriimonas ginsengisoli Gsoil 348 TaxID=661478 RepID=A0A068NU17_FIMGI|nr:NAD(P)/FAD-dependent oxidoreductase [Fimbriimonas ginsengisoli]AIE85064.1 halogenase [Fimbriimonas ginsengisoli Gsoil 348]
MKVDVAIIGGGPGGSTCGGFLKKYQPGLKVAIFERDTFPRDHIGESQLPVIGAILHELGVWDKVEAADFPIKVGGTYRWGNSDDLWDFHFLPHGKFDDAPRPGKFEGQRRETALQVDRSIYDKILLDHARELGCDVYEATGVREVLRSGDTVKGLVLEDGQKVEARYYIDASGHSGFLRRAMGIGIEEPSALRNIAIWDYWQNAEWAVNIGVGGTRIQVMSVGYGWLWFIPLSPTRTSLGLVCPADYYKKSGMRPEELYMKAIQDEPRIRGLTRNGSREGQLSTTKDWSFVAERLTGENWFLVGEAAGFADPILSAGLSLTHASAREAAYTIMEMDRGSGKKWLRAEYDGRNRRRVLQHIKFADYWYTANAHFSDLKEYTREIARDAGLELDAEKAFQWLGTGGFIEEDLNVGGFGTVSFNALHQISRRLSDKPAIPATAGFNGFVLDLAGAEKVELAHYESGRVIPIPAYRRNGKLLPLTGLAAYLVMGLQHSPRISQALAMISHEMAKKGIRYTPVEHEGFVQTLEAMVRDGWVEPRAYATGDSLQNWQPEASSMIETNHDLDLPEDRRASSLA